MSLSSAPTVIDLFCGIGCSSLGFLSSGFDVRLGVDIDPLACSIYSFNTNVHTVTTDLFFYSPSACLSDSLSSSPDVVLCSPSCQGFSRIRRNGSSDPRNNLLLYSSSFLSFLFFSFLSLKT